jgi:TPR repeat protein
MNLGLQFFGVVLVATALVSSCAQEAAPETYVDVDEQNSDLVDHYSDVDRRALRGVRQADARRALGGNAEMALAIAFAFAEANHVTEARYWFQIASENGSAVAMTHLSVILQESDCRRANYWLERALATGELGGPTENSMKTSLAKYKVACKR